MSCSLGIYLFIYLFSREVGCQIKYVGTTKSMNLIYQSWVYLYNPLRYQTNIQDLDAQFPGRKQLSNLK